MPLSLTEKFREKEVFSSSHSYFTSNLVLFTSDCNKLKQVVYYIRRNIGHRIVTASWIGWRTNLSTMRTFIAAEALDIFQNIPLLNFYSIASFFSLILTLLFLAFLLSLPWNFSFVERALESHSSTRSTVHTGKIMNVGSASFCSAVNNQDSFPCEQEYCTS